MFNLKKHFNIKTKRKKKHKGSFLVFFVHLMKTPVSHYISHDALEEALFSSSFLSPAELQRLVEPPEFYMKSKRHQFQSLYWWWCRMTWTRTRTWTRTGLARLRLSDPFIAAVPEVQLQQPEPRSAGCDTPGNAWRSSGSSSGTSVGRTLSSSTATTNTQDNNKEKADGLKN